MLTPDKELNSTDLVNHLRMWIGTDCDQSWVGQEWMSTRWIAIGSRSDSDPVCSVDRLVAENKTQEWAEVHLVIAGTT